MNKYRENKENQLKKELLDKFMVNTLDELFIQDIDYVNHLITDNGCYVLEYMFLYIESGNPKSYDNIAQAIIGYTKSDAYNAFVRNKLKVFIND